MKHSRNLNYEKTDKQNTIHIIPNTLHLLGSINYYDTPGVFTI